MNVADRERRWAMGMEDARWITRSRARLQVRPDTTKAAAQVGPRAVRSPTSPTPMHRSMIDVIRENRPDVNERFPAGERPIRLLHRRHQFFREEFAEARGRRDPGTRKRTTPPHSHRRQPKSSAMAPPPDGGLTAGADRGRSDGGDQEHARVRPTASFFSIDLQTTEEDIP